eukprot:TRINITY_DN4406_c0_g1_i4.p2 TRINITY_DN4406_c0_g1~~TRINITY_DN4406_c0_g1_i4.p2  ORF type:complete len:142 (-),score=25.66 TRINITY_DN4406_c0_g1_i4:308-733(-)
MKQSEEDVFMFGPHCSVKKHRYMGCAIVELCSDAMCAAIMDRCKGADGGAMLALGGSVVATVSAYEDKTTKESDTTKLFIGWGCRQEKRSHVDIIIVYQLCSSMIADILAEVPISSLAPSSEVVPRCRFGEPTVVDTSAFQ